MTTETSPYLMEEPPTSPGRALLARAFAHWCALHHGLSPEEIAAALEGKSDIDPLIVRQVTNATRLMGEVLAAGQMRARARPVGGGHPEPLEAGLWELDDWRPRLASSAIALTRPFDAEAPKTHWVFVATDDFNAIVEASCADILPVGGARRSSAQDVGVAEKETLEAGGAAELDRDRFLRLPEVKRLTGMSRSTIYDRMKAGRFPQKVEMEGNITAWRESDVRNWLRKPI